MTRSIVRLVVVAATVAVLLAGCSSGEKPTTAVPGDAEGVTLHPYEMLDLSRPDGTDEVALADPSVVKVEDTWYLYGTTDAEGFEMWSSTDLERWTYGGVVWKPTVGTWN